VLQDGRARRRAVQLGGGGGGALRQVLTGVRPGEVVIIDAPADLADGAAVSESRS
jgi:spermidine synthase